MNIKLSVVVGKGKPFEDMATDLQKICSEAGLLPVRVLSSEAFYDPHHRVHVMAMDVLAGAAEASIFSSIDGEHAVVLLTAWLKTQLTSSRGSA